MKFGYETIVKKAKSNIQGPKVKGHISYTDQKTVVTMTFTVFVARGGGELLPVPAGPPRRLHLHVPHRLRAPLLHGILRGQARRV